MYVDNRTCLQKGFAHFDYIPPHPLRSIFPQGGRVKKADPPPPTPQICLEFMRQKYAILKAFHSVFMQSSPFFPFAPFKLFSLCFHFIFFYSSSILLHCRQWFFCYWVSISLLFLYQRNIHKSSNGWKNNMKQNSEHVLSVVFFLSNLIYLHAIAMVSQ